MAVATKFESIWTLYQQARSAEARGEIIQAIEAYGRCIEKFPSESPGYSGLIALLTSNNRLDEAEKVAEAALARVSEVDEWLLFWTAELALRGRDWQNAETLWSVFVERFPTRIIGHEKLIRALAAQGKHITSLQAIPKPRGAAEWGDLSAIAEMSSLAIALLDLGYHELAQECWESIQIIAGAPKSYFIAAWRLFAHRLAAAAADHPRTSKLVEALCSQPDDSSADWLPIFIIELAHRWYRDKSAYVDARDAFLMHRVVGDNLVNLFCDLLQSQKNTALADATNRRRIRHALLQNRRSAIFVIFSIFLLQVDGPLVEDLAALAVSAEASPEAAFLGLLISSSYEGGRLWNDVMRQLSGLFPRVSDYANVRALAKANRIRHCADALSVITSASRINSPAVHIKKRLKIALCVGGQLRGFVAAHASWTNLGLSAHEVSIFVNVWKAIGRKSVMPGQLDRCIPDSLLPDFNKAISLTDFWELHRALPHLMGWFEKSATVEKDELIDLYRTKHVVVEDETSDPRFATMNNAEKMYYKNTECFKLLGRDAHRFDLIIRLRPDREVADLSDPDWARIYEKCVSNRMAIADLPPGFNALMGYTIGDQFAVGSPTAMEAYCSAFDLTYISREHPIYSYPTFFSGHVNLGLSMLYHGFRVVHDPSFVFGAFVDPPMITIPELYDLVLLDEAGRKNNLGIRAIIDGCRRELGIKQ